MRHGYLSFSDFSRCQCCNLVVGSPNNIQVRRASLFRPIVFARKTASPNVHEAFASYSFLNNSRFIAAWSLGGIMPEEAQTAAAPPLSLRTNDSARLSSWAS